jgi:hypothetical protein
VPTYREDVSAPTLWEEGRWSARRVTRFSMFVSALLVAADLAATGQLGRIFDSGFIVLCVGTALAIRPADFFRVGVLPPMLLLGLCLVLGLGHRTAIAAPGDGYVQSVISGLAHHSGALLVGYALALLVLGIRLRVARRSTVAEVNKKRGGAPPPDLILYRAPRRKSTTLVGNEPASPSMTASNS